MFSAWLQIPQIVDAILAPFIKFLKDNTDAYLNEYLTMN